jgi:hypothetical protein
MATTKVSSSVIGDNEVKTVNVLDANITTAKIADDAITLAKLAPGIDGNIISYDASGNPAAVSTGSLGNVLTSSGAGAPPTMAMPTTLATAQSASGTTITFSSLPSGINRIVFMFAGFSTNGTSDILIQLGDSGGLETSGYASACLIVNTSSVGTCVGSTAGIIVAMDNAADLHNGEVTFHRLNSNQWSASGLTRRDADSITMMSGTTPNLSAVCDRIAVTTVNGSDTFDAGSVNIQYGF